MTIAFVLSNGVTVASPPVVRVAGLPAGVLDRLRAVESAALADTVVRLRETLAATGGVLSDELHGVIGGRPSGADKAALVGLRRAVFQGRRPTPREWNDRIAAALPGDLAERLAAWLSMLDDCDRQADRLPGVLAAETESTHAALREVVGDPGFRRALSHASPSLFAATAKWLADGACRPRRPSLIRLAKYVARAAAKTSPYSTFTSTGVGTWTERDPAVPPAAPIGVRGVLELNGYLRQRLYDALLADPRLTGALALRLNPSAVLDGDVVRFLGPAPAEQLRSVPATPAVRECLHILAGGATHTMAALRGRLDAGQRYGDRTERFLGRLTDIGLLHRQGPVADQEPDPLGAMAAWLDRSAATAGPAAAATAELIGRVRTGLRHPAPVPDVAGHVTHQRALATMIRDLAERVDMDPATADGVAFDVVHENAVIVGPAGAYPMPRWRPALEDLDGLRCALGVLDPALPLRLGLGAYAAERFGPGARIPFVLFYDAVARDLARPAPDRSDTVRDLATFVRGPHAMDAALAGAGLSRLRELGRIRDELRRFLHAPAPVAGRIRIPAEALRRLCATWPAWVGTPSSVAWYLQAVPGPEPARLVVNAAHGGHGRGRSRTLHLLRQVGAPAPGPEPSGGAAPALAEFGGLFGFSPNVRLPSVPYEIDYPFTVSRRPPQQRIALGELEVVHDPASATVQLFATGLRTGVRALHLGMMADVLLPGAARLLALAFGTGYFALGSLSLPATADLVRVPTRVVASARIEVGRVTLRRARWVVPAGQVPVRRRGETDAAYLLRLTAWRRACGLPMRSFVRAPAPQSSAAAADWVFDKSRKPVYLDFANWYLLMTFERMVQDCGPVVVFEEALPAPGGDGVVTELVVELSHPETGGA